MIFSQNGEIDSLRKLLNQPSNPHQKAEKLNQIADLFKTTHPDSLKFYAEKALTYSKNNKIENEEGRACLNLGNYNIITGNYPDALEFFDKARIIFEKSTAPASQTDLARAYGSMGIVFSEQSSYDKALDYHLKAVRIYEKEKDLPKLARVYNNVGVVYKAKGEYVKSLEFYQKALKTQKKTGDPTIGITMTNIGNIYFKQGNYSDAYTYYVQAENQFQNSTNYRGLGELYNNLGLYFEQNKEPEKALEIWEKAISSFSQIGDKFGVSDTYYHLGKFYFAQKNYQKALENATKSNALAREMNILETVLLTEQLISEIYEKENNFQKSLEHHKLYAQARDSLVNYENIRNGVRSEMNFESEKRDFIHKEQQQAQKVLFEEQSKRHILQLVSSGLILILTFGLLFLFYNRNQLKKNLTLQKNLAEYEQKALHLQMNPHFVFNCLGSISSFIVQNSNESAIKYLAKFSKLMRLTLEYSKESLIPIDKEIESLKNYLELEQLRFNNAFDFSIHKDKNIEDDLAVPPLLIQPFVENAIIHGLIPKKEYGTVTINFELDENSLICTVTDNGTGIEKSKLLKERSVSAHRSMAMNIIRKRLEMIENSTSRKSNLKIEELKDDTGESRGTKVILVLPVQYIES